MGKATIVGNQGAGLYTVKLEYSGLDGAIAQIEARRAALEARIPQLEAALAQAESDRAQAKQAAESLLNDWLAGIPIDGESLTYEWSPKAMQYAQAASEAMKVPAALINAIGNVQQASMAAAAADSALNAIYAEYLSVTAREAELDRLKTSSSATISAWCADYTEDLTGTVATMEVPGEVNPKTGGGINIRPGYTDQAAWSAAHGQLQHAATLSESGFAWNFTMIQPWMKWRPFWRYGAVTGKDEDNNTLNVSLHPILSKAGAWLAKQTDFNDYVGESLSAVPVVYMECGAEVFENGDEVVVEFRVSGGAPTPFVIGFKENPKECDNFPTGLTCVINTTWYPAETWGSYVLTSYPAQTYGCWISVDYCGGDNIYNAAGYECRNAGLLGPTTGGGEYQRRKTIDYQFNEIADFTISATDGLLFDHTETYANSNYSKYQQNLTAVTMVVGTAQLWVEIHNWTRPEFGGVTMLCTSLCPGGKYVWDCGGTEASAPICAQPVESGSNQLIYSFNKTEIVNWYVANGLPPTVTVTNDKGRQKIYVINYDISGGIYVYYKPQEE